MELQMTNNTSEPMAYLHEHALHGPLLSFQALTDADKTAGFVETPLYTDPNKQIERLERENERLQSSHDKMQTAIELVVGGVVGTLEEAVTLLEAALTGGEGGQ